MIRTVICLSVLLFLPTFLMGCIEDNTAGAACENANCPPNTTQELFGTSHTDCNASVSANVSIDDDGVGASGMCSTVGECVYSCTPAAVCCKGEKWNFDPATGGVTAYSCEEYALGDGSCP